MIHNCTFCRNPEPFIITFAARPSNPSRAHGGFSSGKLYRYTPAFAARGHPLPFCASCGTQVADNVQFCPACGAPILKAGQPAAVAPPVAPGAGMGVYPPGAPPGYPPPGYGAMPGEKSPAIALLLSIVTGLGQLYNKETTKGLVFLAVGALLFITVGYRQGTHFFWA